MVIGGTMIRNALIWITLACILVACQFHPSWGRDETMPTPTPSPFQMPPTWTPRSLNTPTSELAIGSTTSTVPTWTPRPPLDPPTVTPTPFPLESLVLPPLYFVKEGQLFRDDAGQSSSVADVPTFSDSSWVRAGTILYWVDTTSLYQVDLMTGENSTIYTFENQTMEGTFRASASGTILLTRKIEDKNDADGYAGEVWIYAPMEATPRYITTIQDEFALVGLTTDESGFYTVALEESFVEAGFDLQVWQTSEGALVGDVSTVEIVAYPYALISPSGNTLALVGMDCGEHAGDACISVWWRALLPIKPTQTLNLSYVNIPNQSFTNPTRAHRGCAFAWVPMQDTLIYALCDGFWGTTFQEYRGLVRWNLSNSDVEVLEGGWNLSWGRLLQQETSLAVSAEGEWLLGWNPDQPRAVAMHLPSKSTFEITLPPGATVVGWE